MAVTRRVHKMEASAQTWDAAARLTKKLNNELAPAERIVGSHYIDGYWYIITESFGLGPVK